MHESSRLTHWQAVYGSKETTEVSWYAAHLTASLALIQAVTGPTARVIDVGAGAATLVDDLLSAGYRHLTALDVSEAALSAARGRLAERAGEVKWIAGDVTTVQLPEAGFDLWHDRAVLHFLTDDADRQAYVAQLKRALCPGGYALLAPFSLTGPEKCSGLPVVRYDAESLGLLLGPGFTLVREEAVTHHTPGGKPQDFIFTLFKCEEG